MSKTHRNQAGHRRHTRDSFVANHVENVLMRAERRGAVVVRIPERERRIMRDADRKAYHAAYAAWMNGSPLAPEPYFPWYTPKYRELPITTETIRTLIAEETAWANRFWDRMLRDGGKQRCVNWDDCGHKSQKAQRRRQKQATKALINDPDAWIEGTFRGKEDFADYYPDYW